MPYEKDSAYHGRLKVKQIKESGAQVVVVGCSNCRDQLKRRLPKFYSDCDYEVMYLWQLVAESLVIDPWSDAEVDRAEKEAAEQWERFGVDIGEE